MSRPGKRSIAARAHLGADFILGGSGHNAGVINPPAANKHGFWTNKASPRTPSEWLETATRHEGSWWPTWTEWLTGKGIDKTVAARSHQGRRSSRARPLRDDAVMDMPDDRLDRTC